MSAIPQWRYYERFRPPYGGISPYIGISPYWGTSQGKFRERCRLPKAESAVSWHLSPDMLGPMALREELRKLDECDME